MASKKPARAKPATPTKQPRRKAVPPVPTVDAYLAALPPGPRAALTKLRAAIRAAAPRATEAISYRVPTFVHQGPLVAFSASAQHCALHLMSPALVRSLGDELAPYEIGTATIRFAPGEPLPPTLVKKLVRARIAENEKRARG